MGDVCMGDVCIGDVCLGDVSMGDVRMRDVRMGDVHMGDVHVGYVHVGDVHVGDACTAKMANTDVGMGDLCQTISDAHCCCDGIYAPLYHHPTREMCCGLRTYRCVEHESTDRTHVQYTPTVGVGGWVRNLVGYAHHWTLYLPILVHNGKLLGGTVESDYPRRYLQET